MEKTCFNLEKSHKNEEEPDDDKPIFTIKLEKCLNDDEISTVDNGDISNMTKRTLFIKY